MVDVGEQDLTERYFIKQKLSDNKKKQRGATQEEEEEQTAGANEKQILRETNLV